jgi:hypothetical protein
MRRGEILTGTGPHLSALAPEPARPLFLPLLSHICLYNRERAFNTSHEYAAGRVASAPEVKCG